jgi:hypothetical protein
MPTGPFSRQTWQTIEALPGRLLGGLGRLGNYLGSERAAQDYANMLSGTRPANAAGLPKRGVPLTPAERQSQMNAIRAFEAAPGMQTGVSYAMGSGSPAVERAYQQEKARVAQMTAQDPELQRYEKARIGAKTQDEMNAARDIGMEIWAKANPQLAAKVSAGQSGYDTIQGVLAGQAVNQGYGYQMPQQIIGTPAMGMNAPQGLPAVQSMGAADTYGPQGIEFDPEMVNKFQALLNLKK